MTPDYQWKGLRTLGSKTRSAWWRMFFLEDVKGHVTWSLANLLPIPWDHFRIHRCSSSQWHLPLSPIVRHSQQGTTLLLKQWEAELSPQTMGFPQREIDSRHKVSFLCQSMHAFDRVTGSFQSTMLPETRPTTIHAIDAFTSQHYCNVSSLSGIYLNWAKLFMIGWQQEPKVWYHTFTSSAQFKHNLGFIFVNLFHFLKYSALLN